MSLLAFLVLVGLGATASRWPSRQEPREALLRGALAFGALVVVVTESLSRLDAIRAPVVLGVWIGLAAGALAAALLSRVRTGGDLRRPDPPSIPRLPAAACASILLLTAVTAIVAPPNFADAMTYHMPRVAHWIQAGNVDYFPTSNARENFQKPFAEFVILHLQLLSGGDRWANLVQWTAFALCGVTVSLILAELRQPARVQWAGALLVYTVPMAILQSSGAQNDLVVSLWLLAFLLYLWRFVADGSRESAFWSGLALGLALATKGTAYVFAPAMGAALLVGVVATGLGARRLTSPGTALAGLAVAALLDLGNWLRSLDYYGSPVCCSERYLVARLSPADVLGNVLRNTTLHLGIPGLTNRIQRAAEALSPVDLSDPAITYRDNAYSVFVSFHEGSAGNTLLLLAVLAAAVLFATDRRLRRGPVRIWMAVAVVGFLAYAVPLRWQPGGSRLQTPAFLVAIVPVAIVVDALCRRARSVVLCGFFVAALPYLMANKSRPLLPLRDPSIFTVSRGDQYYFERPGYREPYERAAAFVRAAGEPEVGLFFGRTDFEYPLWIAIKSDFAGPPRLHHVGVPREAGRAPPSPPVLVVTPREGEDHLVDGVRYVRIRDFGTLSVLRRSPQ